MTSSTEALHIEVERERDARFSTNHVVSQIDATELSPLLVLVWQLAQSSIGLLVFFNCSLF
jgi:hypothetical protein